MIEKVHFWWSITDNPRFVSVSLMPFQSVRRPRFPSVTQRFLLFGFLSSVSKITLVSFSALLSSSCSLCHTSHASECQHRTSMSADTQFKPPPTTPGLPLTIKRPPSKTIQDPHKSFNKAPLSTVKGLLVHLNNTELSAAVLLQKDTSCYYFREWPKLSSCWDEAAILCCLCCNSTATKCMF